MKKTIFLFTLLALFDCCGMRRRSRTIFEALKQNRLEDLTKFINQHHHRVNFGLHDEIITVRSCCHPRGQIFNPLSYALYKRRYKACLLMLEKGSIKSRSIETTKLLSILLQSKPSLADSEEEYQNAEKILDRLIEDAIINLSDLKNAHKYWPEKVPLLAEHFRGGYPGSQVVDALPYLSAEALNGTLTRMRDWMDPEGFQSELRSLVACTKDDEEKSTTIVAMLDQLAKQTPEREETIE